MKQIKHLNRLAFKAGLALALIIGMSSTAFPLSVEKVGTIIPSGMDTGLLNPLGLCYDYLRNYLIVANTDAHRIAILNRDGNAVKVLGKRGDLRHPRAVAVSRRATLYIAERGSEKLKILKDYDSGSREEYHDLDLAAHRRKAAVQPVAIFVDTEGNIYVADRGNRQVLVFGKDEKFKLSIHDVGEPTDVWVSSGDIFVSDQGFGGIRVYSNKGRLIQTLGVSPAKFREPLRVKALAVDRRMRIWVVEDFGQGIKAIDSLGNPVFTLPESLFSPVDVALDEHGNFYVLERGGGRISIFHILEL